MFFKLRRWINTVRLRRLGARMFDCRTPLNRRLFLREHYWLNRMHHMPHQMALTWAIRQTLSHARLNQSTDRLNATCAEFKRLLGEGVQHLAKGKYRGTMEFDDLVSFEGPEGRIALVAHIQEAQSELRRKAGEASKVYRETMNTLYKNLLPIIRQFKAQTGLAFLAGEDGGYFFVTPDHLVYELNPEDPLENAMWSLLESWPDIDMERCLGDLIADAC